MCVNVVDAHFVQIISAENVAGKGAVAEETLDLVKNINLGGKVESIINQ